jgi:hypothetical protein
VQLLGGDADRLGQLPLRDAEQDPPLPRPGSYVSVNLLGRKWTLL